MSQFNMKNMHACNMEDLEEAEAVCQTVELISPVQRQKMMHGKTSLVIAMMLVIVVQRRVFIVN